MDQTQPPASLEASASGAALRRDLVAGLTVAAVVVPQGMAYALIAGLPPQYGLYSAVVLALLGSLLGSSKHLITGPTNAISLVVASGLATLQLSTTEAPETGQLIQGVCLLGLLAGSVQVLIALLKIGDLTRYISESVVLGFMTGASLLIVLGQVPSFLGLAAQGNGNQHVLYRLWLTLSEGGPIQPTAAFIGAGTVLSVVLLSWLGRRLKVLLPDMLLSLILASVAAAMLGWHPPGRPLDVPWGLPAFELPTLRMSWLRLLPGSALAVALLGLLESLAIAKSIAVRTQQRLDFNRECLAQGIANMGGALFQCMPGSGSLTRSAINYQAGAVSRWSGVIAAGGVTLALLLFSSLAHYVPRPALAGILLVTAWRLVDRGRLVYCIRAGHYDAMIALSTAGAALVLSIEYSIFIGVFLSFLLFVPRAARLQASELVLGHGRVVRERQPEDPHCSRLILYSLEGELFFGAAPELEEYLSELEHHAEQGGRVIVLRLKRARNPDMACLEKLQTFLQEMQRRKVPVLLCGIRPDFDDALQRLGFYHWLPQDWVFLEDSATGSSTLRAVRHAYELLNGDLCATCPRLHESQSPDWYYMI